MKTVQTLTHSTLTVITALMLLTASHVAGATVLISEDFTGTGELHGETPTYLDPAFSGLTWVAESTFGADGTISNASGKAMLDIGDFIDNNRGNPDAIYTVSLTGEPSNDWFSSGFYGDNLNVSSEIGIDAAVGVTLYRSSGDAEGWTSVNQSSPGSIVRPDFATGSGPQTFGVTLDLTQWDGSSNHGTLTYFLGNTSIDYDLQDTPSGYLVGFGTATGTSGSVTSFEFTQVPEPGTLWLLGLGLSSLLWFRRKRNPAA